MSAFDLSQLLWPDASQRRQPQHPVKLLDRFAGGVAYIGADRIECPDTLSSQSTNPRRIVLGEQAIAAKPAASSRLGDAGGSHILVVRLRKDPDAFDTSWTYFLNVGSLSLSFTPYHSDFGFRSLIYDGTVRDSGFSFSKTALSTLVIRFLPGETAFFGNGIKTATTARTTIAGIWEYGNQYLEGPTPDLALLAWVPGVFSDADCSRISDEPYSALFEPVESIGFDYPAGAGGTLQDIAASGAAIATGTASASINVALAGVGVSLASGSASIAASRPLAASGTSTASGTAAPKIDIALSALGLTVASGTAALSSNASGSLAATGSAAAGGSAAAVANVTISASGLAQAAAQAGLAASVLLAGAAAAAAAGNAALAVQLQALAQGAAQASGSATLQGSTAGQLSAGGQATAGGSAALVLDVRLQAAGAAEGGGSAALSSGSAAQIAAAGGATASGAGAVAAQVTLTGAGFVQAMGAGMLHVQIPLQATGAAISVGTASLSELPDVLPRVASPYRTWRVRAHNRTLRIRA